MNLNLFKTGVKNFKSLDVSKENNKDKSNLSQKINNIKSIDDTKFSVTNSPYKEDVGLEEHNKCLKNALSEAIDENEKVNK